MFFLSSTCLEDKWITIYCFQIQLVFLSAAVLLAGFTIGFTIGVHEKGKSANINSKSSSAITSSGDSGSLSTGSVASLHHHGDNIVADEDGVQEEQQQRQEHQQHSSSNEEKNSDYYQPTVQNSSPHDANEPSFHKLFIQLSADNIRRNLRWAINSTLVFSLFLRKNEDATNTRPSIYILYFLNIFPLQRKLCSEMLNTEKELTAVSYKKSCNKASVSRFWGTRTYSLVSWWLMHQSQKLVEGRIFLNSS